MSDATVIMPEEKYPIGATIDLDRSDARVLYVANIVRDKATGAVKCFFCKGLSADGESYDTFFMSPKALCEMAIGDKKPRYGDKNPALKLDRYEKIVAITKPSDDEKRKDFVLVATTLSEYERVLAEMEDLPAYQLCEEQRVNGEETKFIPRLESKDLDHLLRKSEEMAKSFAAGNDAHSVLRRVVGFRRLNEDGAWVRCTSPFVSAEEPKATRQTGTIKAGPKKGQVRTPKAKQAEGGAKKKASAKKTSGKSAPAAAA